MADWHGRSDVVFADASGRVNYCAGATVGAYEWLRWEANLAVALLNHHRQSASTSFGWLFMRPKPFLLAFDAVIVVNDRQSSAGVEPALRRGLGPRLRLLAAKPRPPQVADAGFIRQLAVRMKVRTSDVSSFAQFSVTSPSLAKFWPVLSSFSELIKAKNGSEKKIHNHT